MKRVIIIRKHKQKYVTLTSTLSTVSSNCLYCGVITWNKESHLGNNVFPKVQRTTQFPHADLLVNLMPCRVSFVENHKIALFRYPIILLIVISAVEILSPLSTSI